MSNEYKDWLADRKEEAMDTIADICEIISYDDEDIYDKYAKIEQKLIDMGWL